MKFELNNYHRNVSDEEMISDVQSVANVLGKTSITGEEYRKYGKYHDSSVRRRFGSWKKVLEICELETQGHNFKCTFTDDEVIEDVKKVAELLGAETLTAKEYNAHGKYSNRTLVRKYGSWNNVLSLVGMKATANRNYTNEEMFEEIERIWILLGRQPTTTDIREGISKYSLNSYVRRFGGWRNALQAFVNYIDSDKNSNELTETISAPLVDAGLKSNDNQHKTAREINLRLRFKVMQRDNFKCCICGASPAKDSSIELHIDHIKPWSKGGETVIENLQTLCSKCNLGKSDLELI